MERKMAGIIVQARMGASRLPGKMLLPIEDKVALQHTISRLKRTIVSKIVIATTALAEDRALLAIAKEEQVLSFAGSQHDVLDRYYQAALCHQVDPVIRICGDGVMMDPSVVNDVVRFYEEGGYDYVNNNKPPTFPTGYEVEVFSFKALETAWRCAKKGPQREHVTPHIWDEGKEEFVIGLFSYKKDVSQLQCALNNEQDYAFIKAVFSSLYPLNPYFSVEDVLGLLAQKPELADLNRESIKDYEKMMAEIRGGI